MPAPTAPWAWALGFAVAAAVTNPDKAIVSVQGDSAFGFTGMELETMVRYNLPVKTDRAEQRRHRRRACTRSRKVRPCHRGNLTYGAHYEGMLEALGGKGFYVEDPKPTCAPPLDEAMAFQRTDAHQRASESTRRPQAAAVRLADNLEASRGETLRGRRYPYQARLSSPSRSRDIGHRRRVLRQGLRACRSGNAMTKPVPTVIMETGTARASAFAINGGDASNDGAAVLVTDIDRAHEETRGQTAWHRAKCASTSATTGKFPGVLRRRAGMGCATTFTRRSLKRSG